jgi:hypothetical protein
MTRRHVRAGRSPLRSPLGVRLDTCLLILPRSTLSPSPVKRPPRPSLWNGSHLPRSPLGHGEPVNEPLLRSTSFMSFAARRWTLGFLQGFALKDGGWNMRCQRCQGLMDEEQFFDLGWAEGFMWMRGWRCRVCMHAINPLREANRRMRKLNQLALPREADRPHGDASGDIHARLVCAAHEAQEGAAS